jgi:hypothetical protein
MAQVVECLPSKHEAQSPNSSTEGRGVVGEEEEEEEKNNIVWKV